ncbi:MAG: hypothetical protein K8S56_02265 [Candidatus Cloacimonetes bacterium]|nr:hypothetical protein [Candidatus Cloacimonadota bacterium]
MIHMDSDESRYMMKPGYLMIYKDQLTVYGVCGSGMFIALWDSEKEYSGCCYFLYPRPLNNQHYTAKYGTVALRHLVQSMQEHGSEIRNLKAHLIGAGVLEDNKFGTQNEIAALEVLVEFDISIISHDTGGGLARKFVYDTKTGENITMKVHNIRNKDWYPYNG